MSRAVADATRFTATSPHANSNPLPAASRVYPRNGSRPLPRASLPQASRSPGPPGETPKEKVAWLRAEWRAKNIPKPPLWDRIVVRGRDIADTAHQWTVLGILGFTVLTAGVTAYTFTDMFLYNRRKKTEYLETQKILYMTALAESRRAVAEGRANANHLAMLENERLAELDDERKRKKRYFKEIYDYLFTSKDPLTDPDINEVERARRHFPLPPPEAQRAATAILNEKGTGGMGAQQQQQPQQDGVVQAVEEKRREGEKEMERRGMQGGPLDRLGESPASSKAESAGEKRTWSGWISSFWR